MNNYKHFFVLTTLLTLMSTSVFAYAPLLINNNK